MSIGSWSYEWAKTQQLNSEWQEQTHSTQTWAKDTLVFNSKNFDTKDSESFSQFEKVYFVDWQIAGRGQGTNTWSNPKIGSSLLSTWVYNLEQAPPPFLTLKIGLALVKASHATWPQLPWSLKAQNDLLLHDQKVAGLLLETVSQGTSYKLLIGLGFNILEKPVDISQAASLIEYLGRSITQDEWIKFLSRFFLELQLTLNPSNSQMIISLDDKESLIYYLNQNPLLKTHSPAHSPEYSSIQKCTNIDDQGTIIWL